MISVQSFLHVVESATDDLAPAVLAPNGTSAMFDAIPPDAVASFDPTRPLCALGTTDEIGTTRPQVTRCDIGAVEATPVHLRAALDKTSVTYRSRVVLTGSVRGADGRVPRGRAVVTYEGTPTPPAGCTHVVVSSTGTFRCTMSRLLASSYRFRVVFAPTDTSHPATVTGLHTTVHRATPVLALRLKPEHRNGTGPIAVTLRASSPTAPVDGGTATIRVHGHPAPGCPRIWLAAGRGTCTIDALPKGRNTLFAHLLGSFDFAPARIHRTLVVTR